MATRPSVSRLHHHAWRCRDSEETRAFYEDLLGMKLAIFLRLPHYEEPGDRPPFTHLFFEMDEWETKAKTYVERIQSKRHCWLCGREVQGDGIFFDYYPATIKEYHSQLVEELQQDSGMLRDGNVALCTVCGSVIVFQADEYATKRTAELKDWVSGRLRNHEVRLVELERAAHRRSN